MKVSITQEKIPEVGEVVVSEVNKLLLVIGYSDLKTFYTLPIGMLLWDSDANIICPDSFFAYTRDVVNYILTHPMNCKDLGILSTAVKSLTKESVRGHVIDVKGVLDGLVFDSRLIARWVVKNGLSGILNVSLNSLEYFCNKKRSDNTDLRSRIKKLKKEGRLLTPETAEVGVLYSSLSPNIPYYLYCGVDEDGKYVFMLYNHWYNKQVNEMIDSGRDSFEMSRSKISRTKSFPNLFKDNSLGVKVVFDGNVNDLPSGWRTKFNILR